MSKFSEKGYLSAEAQKWVPALRGTNQELFDLCDAVNEYGMQLMLSSGVNKRSPLELLAAAFLARVLSHFQGAVLLAERGMITEAKVLARVQMEAMFSLAALAKDGDYWEALVRNSIHTQRTGANVCADRLNLPDEEKARAKRRAEELADLAQKLSTEQIAKKAGMEESYNTAYRMLSATVHSHVMDLEEGKKGEEGSVRFFL